MGITGREPYLTSLRDRQSGELAPQFFPATKKAQPGLGSIGQRAFAAAKELNAFYGNLGAATGLGPQVEQREGNRWLNMTMSLAFPNLVGPQANTWQRKRQVWRERRQLSK